MKYKIRLPTKQIMDETLRYRYQADIWYLNDDIKINNNYLYCLDLIDHFTWAESYLLVDKTMETVLSKIKLFILNNGKCKILQSDNEKEFRNHELISYLGNEGIKVNFSLQDIHKVMDV